MKKIVKIDGKEYAVEESELADFLKKMGQRVLSKPDSFFDEAKSPKDKDLQLLKG